MKRKTKHKKKVITELKTLKELWANLLKLGKNLPPSEKHNGTRHPKTVTVDNENVTEIKLTKTSKSLI